MRITLDLTDEQVDDLVFALYGGARAYEVIAKRLGEVGDLPESKRAEARAKWVYSVIGGMKKGKR